MFAAVAIDLLTAAVYWFWPASGAGEVLELHVQSPLCLP